MPTSTSTSNSNKYGSMATQQEHTEIMDLLNANAMTQNQRRNHSSGWNNPFSSTSSTSSTPTNDKDKDKSGQTERRNRFSSDPPQRTKVIGYAPDLLPLMTTPKFPNLNQYTEPSSDPQNTPMVSKFAPGNFLREGSVRGSVFNLCSATLGAGALALPYAFREAGLILGILLLIIASLATQLSIDLLIRAANKTNLKSYELLTVYLYGQKVGILVEFCIISFCFGTCVAYIVAVGDILQSSLLDVFINEPWFPMWITREVLMIAFFLLIMFPLSLFDKINSLRFSSFFGVASIFFLVFATTFHSISNLVVNGYDNSWGMSDIAFMPPSFTGAVKAAPTMMFAFTCQVNVFSIYEELEHQSTKRMKQVTTGATSTAFTAYLFMGVFGYLDFGGNVQGNVLNNYCVQQTHDALMISAFVCIVITIVMAFPLNVFPLRFTMSVIIARWRDGKNKDKRSGGKRGSGGGEDDPSSPFLGSFQGQGQDGNVGGDDDDDVENTLNPAPLHTAPSSSSNSDSDRAHLLSTSPLPSSSPSPNTATNTNNQPSKTEHFLLTFLISSSSLVTAINTPNINTIFSLLGSTSSAFVCFVLPAAFALHPSLNLGKNDAKLNLGIWALAGVGGCVGVVSTAFTLWDALYGGGEGKFKC